MRATEWWRGVHQEVAGQTRADRDEIRALKAQHTHVEAEARLSVVDKHQCVPQTKLACLEVGLGGETKLRS